MPIRTKKQHYVPQFLLRYFATGTHKTPKLWVLDKRSKAVRYASIRDVAHENAFYEYNDPDGTRVELERLMEKIDSVGARIIRQVVNTGHLVLSVEDKVWFSYVIACQMSRTPTIRNDMEHLRKMIINKWGSDVQFEGDMRSVGEHGVEDSKFSSLMLLKQDVPKFAKILQSKAWFLDKAPHTSSFIISDQPVALYNGIKRPHRGNLGLNNIGIEIYMPLSAQYCLHLICPLLTQFSISTQPNGNKYREGINHGSPVHILPENVTFANSCQVIWAERWVFAQNRNDLDMPLDMLRTSPELMEGPGTRQKIADE